MYLIKHMPAVWNCTSDLSARLHTTSIWHKILIFFTWIKTWFQGTHQIPVPKLSFRERKPKDTQKSPTLAWSYCPMHHWEDAVKLGDPLASGHLKDWQFWTIASCDGLVWRFERYIQILDYGSGSWSQARKWKTRTEGPTISIWDAILSSRSPNYTLQIRLSLMKIVNTWSKCHNTSIFGNFKQELLFHFLT